METLGIILSIIVLIIGGLFLIATIIYVNSKEGKKKGQEILEKYW